MKKILYIFLLFSLKMFSQETGIPLYQLEYAIDSTYVIGAKPDGEPIWIKVPRGNIKGTGVPTRVAWWAGTDSLSSDAALYWDNVNKRLGVNNVSPMYGIDINGSLRVATRTGTASTGAGFTADGQLVAYSLDTGATAPNTYVTSGMYINVTGTGTFADPYVINNTFGNQQITSATKSGGIIALVESGTTWNLNINDADSSNTNELQDLYPYSTGFALSHITSNLQDTVLFDYAVSGGGTFVPSSGYIAGAGINITSNTITNTSLNTDAQAISKVGNVISITGNASTVNIANGTPTEGQVMIWQSGNWVPVTNSTGNIVQGTGVTLSGTLTNRLVGSGNVTINSSGGSGGTTIEESINGSLVTIGTSYTTICDLTLTAGTWKIDAVASFNAIGEVLGITMELFNVTSNATLFTSRSLGVGGFYINLSATKKVTLDSTSTVRLRAIKDNTSAVTLEVPANRGIITAIK